MTADPKPLTREYVQHRLDLEMEFADKHKGGDTGSLIIRLCADWLRMEELLIDAWNQLSIEDSNESRWAGGLSTAEDIQEFLTSAGRLSKKGMVR